MEDRASSLRSSTLGSSGARSLQTMQSSAGNAFAFSALSVCTEQACLLENRCARMVLVIESQFDVACWVSLDQGHVDGAELPLIIAAGEPSSASFRGDSEGIEGSITIEGFTQALPFHVHSGTPSGAAAPDSTNFVVEPGKLRASVLSPANQEAERTFLPSGTAGAPGIVAETRITKDSFARFTVSIRRATQAEVRRHEGCEALQATEGLATIP